MTDPTPKQEDAPEDFWAEFGKFAAKKMNLFDEFMQSKKEAPGPEPKKEDDPPAPKKRSWFGDE